MTPQAAAILWAQWRTMRNFYPRGGRLGLVFTAVIGILWYGLWVVGALAAGVLVAEAPEAGILYRFLAPGLLLSFLYWQLVPVLMVSAGASLQMRKLRVYPIPHGQLFSLEVMLRLSTAVEVMLMLAGTAGGLLWNPHVASWRALVLIPFVLFNLFLSAGLRDLITRLMAWKRMREAFVLLIVLLAALPQLMLRNSTEEQVRAWLEKKPFVVWPWTAAAQVIAGEGSAVLSWGVLLSWCVAAYLFGRWQFERGLQLDEDAARSPAGASANGRGWSDLLFRLPARLLPDPLAVMMEKELRTLARSPRFRIVFLMGFTFGLLIWMPMAFGRKGGFAGDHFLVIVAAYSILLLSEVCIWNVFGFDRGAAQIYWLAPFPVVWSIVAKNLVAAFVVILELCLITAVCLVFRIAVSPRQFVEAVLLCVVLLAMLMTIGNWSSLKFARPIDPNQNWKGGSTSRFQAMLLLVYPVLSLPFLFAYFARWAWEAEWAFYAVLGITAAATAIAYALSLETVGRIANADREQVLHQLSQGSSPIGT